MLREAAGVRLDLSSVSPPANVTDLLHQQAQSSVLTRKYPGLEISDVGNMEALKELAIAYDLGELAGYYPCLWMPWSAQYMCVCSLCELNLLTGARRMYCGVAAVHRYPCWHP